jgi:hypothetical protein
MGTSACGKCLSNYKLSCGCFIKRKRAGEHIRKYAAGRNDKPNSSASSLTSFLIIKEKILNSQYSNENWTLKIEH